MLKESLLLKYSREGGGGDVGDFEEGCFLLSLAGFI